MGAVDVRRLLQEAVERPGVNGVIGIIDTCAAAAAQPRLVRQTRLSLLMACPVGHSPYDMDMPRPRAALLQAAVRRAEGERLKVSDVAEPLAAALPRQALTHNEYNRCPPGG